MTSLSANISQDGYLLLPYSGDEFLDYGPTASAKLPVFVEDSTGEIGVWDPAEEPCEQKRFRDFTGADSLGSAFVSLVVFVAIQWLERNKEHGKGWLSKYSFMSPYAVPTDEDATDDRRLGWLSAHSQHKLNFLGRSMHKIKQLNRSMRGSLMGTTRTTAVEEKKTGGEKNGNSDEFLDEGDNTRKDETSTNKGEVSA